MRDAIREMVPTGSSRIDTPEQAFLREAVSENPNSDRLNAHFRGIVKNNRDDPQ